MSTKHNTHDTEGLTSVELFSGGGGLALGVARAGFHHLALIEWDENACETLRANYRRLGLGDSSKVMETDVRLVDFSQFADRVTLLAGGAPCQPFSLGGKHGGDTDHRNMFPEVFRALREIRPQAFLLENVRGLTRPSFQPYFEYILLRLASPCLIPKKNEDWQDHKRRLERLGSSGNVTYEVAYQLVDCADYGIPQRRHRVFIVGFLRSLGIRWPGLPLTHSEGSLYHSQWITKRYWKEHHIRPPKGLQEPNRNGGYSLLHLHKRWRTVRDAIVGLPKPPILKEHPEVLNHVLNPGARPYAGHNGSPIDLPAKALKAGDHGVPGGENTLQLPDGSLRYFTVREAARLQTFPDDYEFRGSWTESFRQLGNGVPVEMARQFAGKIAELLKVGANLLEDSRGRVLFA